MAIEEFTSFEAKTESLDSGATAAARREIPEDDRQGSTMEATPFR
nr:unnamed protein product [Digitaria exilis]